MSSIEFLRRCDYYRFLSCALPYFINDGIESDFVYQCTVVDSFNKSHKSFSLLPSLGHYNSPELKDCFTIYIERFYRRDFDVQLRYFKSFVSRLSAIQLSRLSSDLSLLSLLEYADRK